MPKATGVYRDKRNGTWYFKAQGTHVDPTTGRWKQVTRRGFATATDARLARQRYLEELERKRELIDGNVAAAQLTVGQLVARCLDEAEAMNRLAAKTLFDYRNYATSYINPHLGHLSIHEVTPQHITDWQLELARNGATQRRSGKLSANTIRLARAPLNRAFKYAITHGMLRTNPVEAARPPAKVKSKPAHWTPEEARTFLAWHEGDRLYPLWAFLLSAGLRIGELVWLRWPNVEIDRQLVRINEFAATLGYEVVPSAGKSADAVRTIDLDRHLVEILTQQAELQAAEHHATSNYLATDYVFTKPAGGSYHPQSLSRLLGRVSTEIGLPRLTAHGLRHTSATLMLASGVPPKVAAERLGHADATLFTNLYSHVTPTMQREAAKRLGRTLFE